MNHEAIADTIKRYREQKQLSQDQLADAVGVSQQAVANWENGKSRPKGTRLDKLYDVLGREFKEEMETNPELAALSLSPVTRNTPRERVGMPPPNDPAPRITLAVNPLARNLAEELEQEIRGRLPDYLQENLGRAVTLAGHKWQADYLSDTVHIEFLSFDQSRIHRSILAERLRRIALRMLTIRLIQGDHVSGLLSVIIVISPSSQTSILPSSVLFELALHQIEVAFVQSAEQAAGLLMGIEQAGALALHPPEDSLDAPEID